MGCTCMKDGEQVVLMGERQPWQGDISFFKIPFPTGRQSGDFRGETVGHQVAASPS